MVEKISKALSVWDYWKSKGVGGRGRSAAVSFTALGEITAFLARSSTPYKDKIYCLQFEYKNSLFNP